MDHPIEPSIFASIDQGRGQRGQRGQRGGKDPQAWSRHRAQLLTAASQGLETRQIAGAFGISKVQVRTLVAEACDAVLRGGAASAAADAVCTERWRNWCELGDTEACGRVRSG